MSLTHHNQILIIPKWKLMYMSVLPSSDLFLCAPFIVVVGLWGYAVGRHGLGVVIVDAQWIV